MVIQGKVPVFSHILILSSELVPSSNRLRAEQRQSWDLHFQLFLTKFALPLIILISINDTIFHQKSQAEIFA
jgi:hypothetical protein